MMNKIGWSPIRPAHPAWPALTMVAVMAFLSSAPAKAAPGTEKLLGHYAEAGAMLLPATPPLGLKTYLDLGIMCEENTLIQRVVPPVPAEAGAKEAAVAGKWVHPLYDAGNLVMFGLGAEAGPGAPGFVNPRTVWCAYSKDNGHTWTEPRFLLAFVSRAPATAIAGISYRKTAGKALHLIVTTCDGGAVEARFKENDLVRLATASDLRRAPPGRFLLNSVPPENKDVGLVADYVCVGGDILVEAAQPVAGYHVDAKLGLLIHGAMEGSVVHTAQSHSGTLYEARAFVTPKGDYVMMVPDGAHATSPRPDANQLKAYRSTDQGRTWAGPFFPFGETEKHHAALPVVPKGGKRIYVFGTQRGPVAGSDPQAKAFGYRYSDDDAHTWSAVNLVRLGDGQLFPGTGVIEMTETDGGTLMVGFHHARILRGTAEEGYRNWSVVTPQGGEAPDAPHTLDELRVIGLEAPGALAVARSTSGGLWAMRSANDGESWSAPAPIALRQPDAPPMVFKLSDGRTLIALHHNRAVLRSVHEPLHSQKWKMPMPSAGQVAAGNAHPHSYEDWISRAEVWFSLSTDGGHQWSEPRLLFANALAETLEGSNPNYQCSYVDLFVDRGYINLIIPHRWQRVVHLRFPESKLAEFATRRELADAAK